MFNNNKGNKKGGDVYMGLPELLVALLNVITIGGIIIWVEATAMTGGKKQTIGVILIVIGIILGLGTAGVYLLR